LRDSCETCSKPFDARLDLGERAVIENARDLALDELVLVVARGHGVPRIGQQLLAAQADAARLLVNAQHVDFDLVAQLDDFTRMVDAVPRQLGNVDEAVGPTQIDERAEVAHTTDAAGANVARLERLHQFAAFLLLPLLVRFALRHDQAVTLAVDLDDLDADLLAAQAGQPLLAATLAHAGGHVAQVGDGHEAADAAVGHDDAALVITDDFALEDLAAGQQRLGLDPVLVQPRQANGDDERLGVFRLHDVDRHLIVDLERLAFLRFQLGQVRLRHNAVSLQPQVDDEALRGDGDDYAGADVARLRHVVAVLVQQIFQ
jgi:hypothetical protein